MVTALSAVSSARCNTNPSPSTKFGNGTRSVYVTVGHDVSGLPSIAKPAFCGLSEAPLGENTEALTGFTIGPGRFHRPNPSVNHAIAAAATTITPTSAARALVRLLPRRGDVSVVSSADVTRVVARAGNGRRFRRPVAREDGDLVGVEGAAVPDAADLDWVAVRELT